MRVSWGIQNKAAAGWALAVAVVGILVAPGSALADTPSPEPSAPASSARQVSPSPGPAATDLPAPTAAPIASPTAAPTAAPTASPSQSPTAAPAQATPTAAPTAAPAPSRQRRAAAVDNQDHLYTLDGFGGIHQVGSSPAMTPSGYWNGWDIARGIALFPDGTGGYTLDGQGGIHSFGSAPPLASSGWSWDIARAIQLAPWSDANQPAGWVLDGFGGLHEFGGAPPVSTGAYWNGWDIARGFVILPDSTDATTLGGYVLDGLGGLHPFGRAPFIPVSGWSWDIARGIAVLPTATYTDAGGYILDGWGGIHVFGNAPTMNVGGWPGWDIAKSITLWTGATGTPGGWVLDGFGGMNVFGSAPGKAVSGYWNGWDIARGSGGAGSGGGGKPLPPPKAKKHKIVVNLGAQHLWAYEGDSLLLDTDVATGRPALPTPPGDYHIFFKSSPYVMHSPWPYGSPYWYPDVWMNYAMEFRSGGYFLHDAPWRTHYGPGTNLWDGTHGCVNVPLAPMARLYAWAQLDDEVLIQP